MSTMNNMLEGFPTEKITLVKENGQIFDNINALVRRKKIFIDNENIPIEETDKIIRRLPNKLNETYIILDRGYYPPTKGIPGHYQISVEKEGAARKKPVSNNIIITTNGENNKININSTDNSMDNSVKNYHKSNNVFDELKSKANEINGDDRKIILEKILDMEKFKDKKGFINKYNEFIQSAANHMTLFAPFIPLLSQMIVNK